MKLRQLVVVGAVLASLFTTGPVRIAAQAGPPPQLKKLFEDYFEERLRLFPLEATRIADPRYNHVFTNTIGEEHRSRQRGLYDRYRVALTRIDRSRLAPADRLDYDVMKDMLESELQKLRFFDNQDNMLVDNLMPVNQFWGTPIQFVQLGSGGGSQLFKTVRDYDDFLKRVDGYEVWVDTAIANMRKGAAQGVTQPRILMERVLPQLRALIAPDPAKSIFWQPVAKMPADIPAAERERLTAAYRSAIESKINPMYQRLHDFIRDEYIPKCRTTAGLSALPEGRERYAVLVKAYTTTDLTPDQIHEIGLREVKRIRGEMEKIKDQVGFKGDLKAFFDHIRTDPKFYPYKTDEQVLDAYRAVEARIEKSMPKFFGIRPKSRFEIRATEKYRAAGASEQYTAPSPDGTRPGIFWVPITDPRVYNNTRTESLFLHEAIPGHHFQDSLQQENTALPKFRKYLWINVFGEGWGLYTESLGKELGLYTDPYQYFGALTQEIHRAIRLVVDTGMHSKGWSREDAIKYSLENEGLAEDRIVGEVERYMAVPGQALGYMIGSLKITELRERAKAKLGKKFDIREFHDQVLKDGGMPLSILEAKIDAWIAGKR